MFSNEKGTRSFKLFSFRALDLASINRYINRQVFTRFT